MFIGAGSLRLSEVIYLCPEGQFFRKRSVALSGQHGKNPLSQNETLIDAASTGIFTLTKPWSPFSPETSSFHCDFQ